MKIKNLFMVSVFVSAALSACAETDLQTDPAEDSRSSGNLTRALSDHELFLTGGSEQKTWVWDKEVPGHLGEGDLSLYTPNWWPVAAGELADFDIYDDELRFISDGSYELQANGFVYVESEAVASMGGQAAGKMPQVVAYTQPAGQTWEIRENGGKLILALSQNAFPSYLCNTYALANTEYEILSLTENKLSLRFANQDIDAWYYNFIPSDYDPGTGGDEPTAATVPSSVADNQDYLLVWNDEFDSGLFPSSSDWWFEQGGHGWGNNELQHYVDRVYAPTGDTTAVNRNGKLYITAHKLNSPVNGSGRSYISTRMNSNPDWTYGYFEMRAMLPPGRGTWPAFWMLPTDAGGNGYSVSDGELDIMEYVGVEPGLVHFSAHSEKYTSGKFGPNGQIMHSASKVVPDCESTFHTYAMEWTPDYVKGLVDGEVYFTYTNPHHPSPVQNRKAWPFDKPFYLKLNLAIGGSWGGYDGVDDSIFPVSYVIDHVRVFQKQ